MKTRDVPKWYSSLDDGWIAVRPSGTEPKIKLYFEIYSDNEENAEKRIKNIVKIMEAYTK